MTKDEAIALIKKGERITHRYFTTKEWITMVDNKLVDEHGYSCDPDQFWQYRTHPVFDDGWERYVSDEELSAHETNETLEQT